MTRRPRSLILTTLVTWALVPVSARAQAPPAAGPLVLLLPPSARTAALAGAWVAGRDHDVIFYNPAQLIGARPGIDLSLIRYGPASTSKSIASTYAGGKWSLTLGWGVQFVDFSANAPPYPRAVDALLGDEPSNGTSALLAVGGAIVIKGFRIGAAGKYVSERAKTDDPIASNPSAVLADVGVARNTLGGVAAFAMQNIGGGSADDDTPGPDIPTHYAYGWSMVRVAGPVDVGIFTQVRHRGDWASPAAGLEVGYGWIEGYSLGLRAGARRPESDVERPFALGAAMTADRLTVEYAVKFFEGGRTAHGVTIRWR